MRFIYTIFFLFATLTVSAQKISTFKEVLKTATEISISDSILINYFSLEKTALGTTTAESFFTLIYLTERRAADQKAEYFVAGKITSHKDFDILLLCAEKSVIKRYSNDLAMIPLDRSFTKELYFVLLDKEGNYKNDFLVAMNYEAINDLQKTTIRNISSWIYKDLKIVQKIEAESRPTNVVVTSSVNQETKTMNFSMQYHINDYGVFVAYPKYKSN